MDCCVKLETLVIGGLLNNDGAKIVGQAMKKYSKIKNLKLLNCKILEKGLYSILEQGFSLEKLDLTGSLLCCSGQAFHDVNKEYNMSHRYSLPLTSSENVVNGNGVLANMKSIKMSVMASQKHAIKNLLERIFGESVKLTLELIKT